MLVSFFYIIFGLTSLLLGAHLLVNSCITVARQFGVPSLVVSLTVVAFGTSLPELLISSLATLRGANEIAVGNIVGSNIFNILGILGLCALISPLYITKQVIVIDIPVMVATAILFWWLATLNTLSFAVSFIFLALLIIYIAFQWRFNNAILSSGKEEEEEDEPILAIIATSKDHLSNIIITLAGIIALAIGAHFTIEHSLIVARQLQVSELFIGATILAVGTSLPELITSLYATIRGHQNVAIGNVIGSCVFNILGVGGASMFFSSKVLSVSHVALVYDIPVMCAASLACVPFCMTGSRLSRIEGLLFLLCYIGYIMGLLLWNSSFDTIISTTRYAVVLTLTLTAIMLIHMAVSLRGGHK